MIKMFFKMLFTSSGEWDIMMEKVDESNYIDAIVWGYVNDVK